MALKSILCKKLSFVSILSLGGARGGGRDTSCCHREEDSKYKVSTEINTSFANGKTEPTATEIW